ncbi:MAG: hypothetical protein GTN99_08100 [Candidatus Dadabacteria bacterium]|nr:hypothetical protein [Candidatus Dadabacteria bacterium]
MAAKFSALPETSLEPTQNQSRGIRRARVLEQSGARPSTPTPIPRSIASNVGQLRRGFRQGTTDVEVLSREALATGAELIGADRFAEGQRAEADDARRRVEGVDSRPRVERIEDINSLADAVDWLAGIAGRQAPIVSTVAGTGLTGLIGRSVLPRTVLPALTKQGATTTGVAGAAVGLETGAISEELANDPELDDLPARDRALTAAVGGVAAGSLDALPILRAFNRVGLPRAGLSSIRRVAKEAGIQTGLEASTEAAQTVIERGAHQFLNDNIEILSDEGISEILNAAAAGAVIGGGIGTVSQGLNELIAPREVGSLDGELEKLSVADERRAVDLDSLDPNSPRHSRDVTGIPASARILRAGALNPDSVDQDTVLIFKAIADGDLEYTDEVKAALAQEFRDPDSLVKVFADRRARFGDNKPLRADARGVIADDPLDNKYVRYDDILDEEDNELVNFYENGDPVRELGFYVSDAYKNATATYFTPQKGATTLEKLVGNLSARAISFLNPDPNFAVYETSLDKKLDELQSRERESGQTVEKVTLKEFALKKLQEQGVTYFFDIQTNMEELAHRKYQQLRNTAANNPQRQAKVDAMWDLAGQDKTNFLTNFEILKATRTPKAFTGRIEDQIEQSRFKKLLQTIKRTRDKKKIRKEGQMEVTAPSGDELFISLPGLTREGLFVLEKKGEIENAQRPTMSEISKGFAIGMANLVDQGFDISFADIPDLRTIFRTNEGVSIPYQEVKEVSRVRAARLTMRNQAKRINALHTEIKSIEAQISRINERLQKEPKDKNKLLEQRKKLIEGAVRRRATIKAALKKGRSASFVLRKYDKKKKSGALLDRLETMREEGYYPYERGREAKIGFDPREAIEDPLSSQPLSVTGSEATGFKLDQSKPLSRDPRIAKLQEQERANFNPIEAEKSDELFYGRPLDSNTLDSFLNRIKESRRLRQENNEDFTFSAEGVKNARGLRVREETFISRVAKALNIPVPTLLTPDAIMLNKEYMNYFRMGSHGFSSPKENIIAISPNITDIDFRRELIGHELGHIVLDRLLTKDEKAFDKVWKEWSRWRKEHVDQDSSIMEVFNSKKAFKTVIETIFSDPFYEKNISALNPEQFSYVMDFHEWFADQTARYLEERTLPAKTAADKFFKAVADTLIKLYRMVKKNNYAPAHTVAEFYDGVMYKNKAEWINQQQRHLAESVQGPPAINKEIDADLQNHLAQPFSENSTESLVRVIRYMRKNLPKEDLRVIGKITSNKFLRRQVRRLLNNYPRHKQRAEAEPDYFTGVVYQLWLAGELELGPATQDAFSFISESIENMTGILRDSTVANEIFERVQAGKIGMGFSPVEKITDKGRITRVAVAVKKVFDLVTELFDKYINTADGFMHSTGNPYLIELANMFSHRTSVGEREGRTYLDAKKDFVARFRNKWHNTYGNATREERAEALEILQNPEKYASLRNEKVKKFVQRTWFLMREIYNYQRGAGVGIHDRGKQYFPWVFDPRYLHEHKDDFISLLNRKEYAADISEIQRQINENITDKKQLIDKREVIERIWHQVSQAGGIADLDPTAFSETTLTPYAPSLKARSLGFLYDNGTPESREILSRFFDKNIDHTVMEYINQSVKHAEFTRKFGKNGRRIKQLMQKARAYGATDDEINMAGQYAQALMGTYGGKTNASLYRVFGMEAPQGEIVSPFVQKTTGLLITIQNMALLGLATFTSLVDPVGIAVRSGSMNIAWKSARAGGREIVNKIKRIKDPEERETRLRQLAESLGAIESKLTNEALEWEYGATWMGARLRFINETYFKAIGLSQWTAFTRMMALQGAQEFIKVHMNRRNMTSRRYIEELGLRPDDVIVDAQGEVLIYTYEERLNRIYKGQKLSENDIQRDDRIRNALNRFVDDAILRPNAALRPIWASDPHYALVFHLKSFMYSFHDRILRRAVNELNEGEMMPILMLTMFIPAMMFADMIRDMIKEALGANLSYKSNWSMGQRVSSAAQRSGVTGLSQLLIDSQRDIQYGGLGFESLAGPSFEQLVFSGGNFKLDDLFFNNDRGTWKTVEDNLPLQNLNLWNFLVAEGNASSD